MRQHAREISAQNSPSSDGRNGSFSQNTQSAALPRRLRRDFNFAPRGALDVSLHDDDSCNGAAVLVVEDDPSLSRLVIKLLEREGLAVNVAASGAAAVEALESQRPSLMLLDYSLPDMRGDQLIEALAARDRLVPFIVMTGHGNETLAVEMMKRGARDYLVKGGTLLELLSPVVKRVLGELETEERLVQAEEAIQKSIELRAEILDALPAHVAILSREGTILSTNAALRRFAVSNQAVEDTTLVGASYLDVGRGMYGNCPGDSAAIVQGISDVLSGRRAVFALEYGNLGGKEERCWRMIVAPLARAGHGGAVVMHVDVTDRKLAERALEASEMRFRSLADSSPVGIFLAGPEGGIRYSNPQLQRIYAASADELAGQGMLGRIHAEDRQRTLAQWTSQIPAGHEVTVEFRVQASDRVRWVHLKSAPLRGGDGQLLGHVGSVVDVTEEKLATDELRASEERLRLALTAADMRTWDWDMTSGTLRRLQSVGGGQPVEETVQQSLAGLFAWVHPEDRQKVSQAVQRAIEDDADLDPEFRVVSAENEVRWVNVRGRVIKDQQGNAQRIVGVTADITARKQAEESLRQSEERYRLLVEHAPDAIFVHDGERVVFINDAGMRLFGATDRNQIVDRPVVDLVHPDSQDAVRQRMQEILEQNRAVPVLEEKVLRLDGGVVDADVTATPCIYEGKRAVQVMMRDISDRRRAEQALREHQSQLAHVMRLNTMGQMLSELAHEINQPLYAIANYSSACKQMLQSQGGDYPSDVLRWMQQISDQANRAGEILRRISRFVRKESPEQTVESLNTLVRSTVELVEIDARVNRGRVRLDLPEPSPRVRVDRIQIEQVLVNLLRNAFEALEETQKDRVITVSAKRQNGDVLIAVRDRGRGLSPSEQVKLFDAFFTTKPEGMGMGLPISRSIIEAHGGELWAAPNPDRGMTFYFTLPLVSQVQQ
jgi:PAS domain S-box-containing protein